MGTVLFHDRQAQPAEGRIQTNVILEQERAVRVQALLKVALAGLRYREQL
ncbi:MAG: hypothetical protein GVY18_03840 [Bacteroidetes bacterium]|nr:hypothetical protein [Bacteroidota bacterium]